MKKLYGISIICMFLMSCKTVNLEPHLQSEKDPSITEEAMAKEEELYLIEELIKETDIEPTVIYVEKPIYVPFEGEKEKPLTGKEGVLKELEAVTREPLFENGRLRSYAYHPDFVYEIHCQTFHTTDIQLEPGERVLEVPYISEPEVWQIGAGVSLVDGLQRQHFFIKPDYSKLISNLIIVTDRRVYHIELKSFTDYYMPIVRWTYPLDALKKFQLTEEKINTLNSEFTGVNPEYLSFDYKMNYPVFKKPSWLPKQVYDDGRNTYIVLNEESLRTELPTLFNKKNELINYRVQKNVLIIDQLITKITLKLGKVKVVVEKKK